MTKDVIVSISGLQADIDRENPLEVITTGSYYFKNGKHYVLFDELLDDSSVPTQNTIKISDHRVDVIKKGEQNVHMVFEPDMKNVTCYETPFGSMMLGINTLDIRREDDPLHIRTSIDYALELNEAHVSDCLLQIEIKSSEARDFHLN